jgi:hypothetical protein
MAELLAGNTMPHCPSLGLSSKLTCFNLRRVIP